MLWSSQPYILQHNSLQFFSFFRSTFHSCFTFFIAARFSFLLAKCEVQLEQLFCGPLWKDPPPLTNVRTYAMVLLPSLQSLPIPPFYSTMFAFSLLFFEKDKYASQKFLSKIAFEITMREIFLLLLVVSLLS